MDAIDVTAPIDLAEVLSRPASQRALAAPDVTHYTVLCLNKGIGYFAERSLEDSCSLDQTIADIVTGQFEAVAKVFAFNPVEHTCDDVTEELAVEIAGRCDAGEPISPELYAFIETNAGLEHVRGLRILDRTFAAA